jgi:hypothetical protein
VVYAIDTAENNEHIAPSFGKKLNIQKLEVSLPAVSALLPLF